MKSHSREFLGVRAASALMNVRELCGLPRVDQEILHQRTWQGQSNKIRIGNDYIDLRSIPGRSILISATMELPVTILDLLQR